MSGFYIFKKYRKEAIQLSLFFLIIIIISILITIFFPSINKKEHQKKDTVIKEIRDSI